MINLCLVVIATQFSETKQREHRLMLEQRQRYLSSSTVASYAEPGDCYEEIFQYVCHILRKAKRRALGLYQALQSRRQAPGAPGSTKPGPHVKEPRHYSKWPTSPGLQSAPRRPRVPLAGDSETALFANVPCFPSTSRRYPASSEPGSSPGSSNPHPWVPCPPFLTTCWCLAWASPVLGGPSPALEESSSDPMWAQGLGLRPGSHA